ncbi:MAG: hypothetical protein ACRDWA_10325 [Acidimicrobiia bacterium]
MAALLLACSNAPLENTSLPTASTTIIARPVAETTTSLAPSTTTAAAPSLVDQLRSTRIEPLPPLSDGRPATFVGVTDDYAAVEVDTLTGEIVRPIAQIATAADVANAECAACINAVDQVWRLADGSAFLVSECCEPASGSMFWADATAEPVTPENHSHEGRGLNAWYAEPAPSGPFVATAGYFPGLISYDGSINWSPVNSELQYAASPPAWSWDLSTLFVLVKDAREAPPVLTTAELDSDLLYTTELSWWSADTYPSGLALSTVGLLISFELSYHNTSGRVVIFRPDGTFVRDFPIEVGSSLGGFDPTGTFLIYVDGDGTVHWHDTVDRFGSLAEEFIFASW